VRAGACGPRMASLGGGSGSAAAGGADVAADDNVATVFNYETVRWLEKHHRHKKVSRQRLDQDKILQLKKMFDALDIDSSGSIDLSELEHAMKFLGIDREQQTILQQFRYMDADGSGSIDFEEFVTVMTSDMVDQHFYLLAVRWSCAFVRLASRRVVREVLERCKH
jgi:hypothetical protein